MVKYCQYCLSYKINRLKECIYCTNCEIYYRIENNNQAIKSIPLEEINQINLKLCKNCNKKARGNLLVKTVKEYYKKLPFCKNCKLKNKIFIRNYYFKNFLLNKEFLRDFTTFDLFLIIFSFFILNYELIFYNNNLQILEKYSFLNFFEKNNFINLFINILYLYVEYKRYAFSYFTIFIFIILYYLKRYEIISWIVLFYCFIRIITSKSYYFKININSNNEHNLNNLIDKLKIK